MSIIHYAKSNISVGCGGPLCNSIIFGKELINYSRLELFNNLNPRLLETADKYIHVNITNYFKQIISMYSKKEENNKTKSEINEIIIKQKKAYFLSHLGLGDNITNIGAINFLLKFYETIYFLCKDCYENNVKLLFQNNSIITIPIGGTNESQECSTIINNITDTDIFISGEFCRSHNLKSKITHPNLLKYIQNDKNYTIKHSHIRDFYYDIGLDLSIYVDYFNINSNEISENMYDEIKDYKIVFLHTSSSSKEIKLDNIINFYKQKEDFIIICVNKNVYDITNSKHNLAEKYVNIPVAYYIDIIKKTSIFHIINSCFSCIIYPLLISKKIIPIEYRIYDRDYIPSPPPISVPIQKSIQKTKTYTKPYPKKRHQLTFSY
jgi:hypothetical protein